ncbi:MAG TPA: hypothetical protein VMW69_10870, partial [Spirochaetia bacterium]|nr:hypothetical protein [Spirochaetia bacterium]
WKEHSERVYRYVATSMDGQNREPTEVRENREFFTAASNNLATNLAPKATGSYDHRDTVFFTIADEDMIVFVHGTPRKPKQFDRIPENHKRRQV